MEILTVVGYMENPKLTEKKSTPNFKVVLNKAFASILINDSYNLFSPAEDYTEKSNESMGKVNQIENSTQEMENRVLGGGNETPQQKLEVEGYPLCRFQKEGRLYSDSDWIKLDEIVSRSIPENSENERYIFLGLAEDMDLVDTKQNGISR